MSSVPLKARLPRGFVDRNAADIAATNRMLEAIRETYELYGFEAVETPFVELTEALGKFLPDQDRPNEGVFSFQDDDESWLSLRYDLTAPLARYVAENFDALPKPYRSYRAGWVFRNEKPGPGRFRQFMQFDADTVGAASVAADAEICMMAADTLERVGIKRGDYVIKVNNRKVLDGVMEAIGLGGEANASRRLSVLRALDKFDRLGWGGVDALLGEGRRDESGDFTQGARLSQDQQISVASVLTRGNVFEYFRRVSTRLAEQGLTPDELASKLREDPMTASGATRKVVEDMFFVVGLSQTTTSFPRREPRDDDLYFQLSLPGANIPFQVDNMRVITSLRSDFKNCRLYQEGVDELEQIASLAEEAGYGSGRILIDPSVVRGLEYYTGPVYEAELTFSVTNEDGQAVRFGSVGGGGRYDGLVGRFRPEPVPATGFSIGVSRLFAALKAVGSPIVTGAQTLGPVVVLVLDRDQIAGYQRLVAELRAAGIRSELYLGSSGMRPQMKYADRRNSPCVVIQGSQERERGEVQIKDLIEGAKAAETIASNAEWKAARPAQFSVPEAEMVAKVQEVLARHR
jgi:histidyl-tRNA synthetase